MYYTAEQIVEMASRAEGFEYIPEDYWIAPIRSNVTDREANKFACVANLMKGDKLIMTTTCTTVPGTPALLGGFKKYNSKGAAIVCANKWMYNSFKYGLHAGRMKALRMIKAVCNTRDGNYNKKAEEYGKEYFSNVACNFHAADWNYASKLVKFLIGHWSYGCIVCNNRKEYNKIIELCKNQQSVSIVIIPEFSV